MAPQRKGKYGKVIEKLGLTQAPSADPQRDELVKAVQQRMREDASDAGEQMNAGYLARHYFELRKEKDRITEEEKNINLELEAVQQLIVQKFEEEGMSRIVLDDGASVGSSEEPYPVVKDPDALRRWVVKNKLEGMLSLNHNTLKALTKQLLIDGQPVPEGVDVFYKTQLERRKGTGPGDFDDIPAPQNS